LSLVETSSKRLNSQPMKSLRDLQGVNEFFLFAEKRIQRFEMKWSASSSEDREFVLIVM